jgi:hypothetical protein
MNSLASYAYTGFLILAAAFIAISGVVGAQTTYAQQSNSQDSSQCTLEFSEPADVFNYAIDDTLEFSGFEKNNGRAQITITNNSDCQLPITLASYEMTSSGNLSDQTVYKDTTKIIAAGSTEAINVALPSCMAQIDLLFDPDQSGAPTNPSFANPNLIGYTYNGNKKDVFAENDIFHFDDDTNQYEQYGDLDNFPDDQDDRPAAAQPADGFNFCDEISNECPAEGGVLPISEPADVFEYAINGTLEFSEFKKQNGTAAITVTNNSNCELPLALGVYEMYDSNFSDQELFGQESTTIASGEQATLESELPSCMAQIDLLYNPDGTNPPEVPTPANPDVIGYTFNQNGNDIFAENDIFHFDDDHTYNELDNFPNDEDDRPQNAGPAYNFCSINGQPDPLTGSCEVSPSQTETGNVVTWSSSANGGDSPYTYNWSLEGKNDNVSGQTVETTYVNEGDFDGTVTITDQTGSSINRTCSVTIQNDDDGGGGGGGRLPPRDSDDDNGGASVAGTQDPEFSVQCQPDKQSYLVGEQVSFSASIDGNIDTDEADFRWASTAGRNLQFEDETARLQYTTPGQKQVGVRVDYEDEYEIAKCSVSVRSAQSGVSLDQVPYTGPGDSPETVAFFVLLVLLAVTGGYLTVRHIKNDEIHIGIPSDHRK